METANQAPTRAEKTLRLITKLLAKAESTHFPAEAQTFQEHAERLMVRYGFEQASIDAEVGKAGKPQEPMVEQRFELNGQYRVGLARGFTLIALAFNTIRVLQANTSSTKIMFLIGAESDVTQILRLFASLKLQMESAMQAWWLGYPYKPYLSPHDKTLERRQFQLGFLSAVAHRLESIHSSELSAGEPGKGLVLAGRRERADEHMQRLYPSIRSARRQSLSAGSSAAHAAGSLAGTMAAVNGAVDAGHGNALATDSRVT